MIFSHSFSLGNVEILEEKINIGEFIYEFITLAVPLKKLHPRFEDELEEDDEPEMIYTSQDEEETDDSQETDPRWEALKKLKGK